MKMNEKRRMYAVVLRSADGAEQVVAGREGAMVFPERSLAEDKADGLVRAGGLAIVVPVNVTIEDVRKSKGHRTRPVTP